MPLTRKGSKILESMRRQYGDEKGERVFYASANKGTIQGVHLKRGRQPVHHSPYHGEVTGMKRPPAGDANDRGAAMTLAKEVAGGLRHYNFADTTGGEPKPRTRGEAARVQQLEEAKKDAAPAGEASREMRGALGSVDARRRVAAARAALKRQQDYSDRYRSGH
jgi:hypothetical protein